MIPIRLNPPRPGQPFPQMSKSRKGCAQGALVHASAQIPAQFKTNSGRGLEQTEAKLGQT